VRILGLDIGGANLKASQPPAAASIQPFELWRHPDGLADALRQLARRMPSYDRVAITMTGELCDCFASRRAGVLAILDAVATFARSTPVLVWQLDGRFVDLAAARAVPLSAAAANWLALATFAGRFAPYGSALVFDLGSTTCDLVPLRDGKPQPQAFTDPERLRARELVYTGVRRTPVSALLAGEGAAELFATTHDVYLLLEQMPEEPSWTATADGRAATKTAAHARLARMICGDAETVSFEDVIRLAMEIRTRQAKLLCDAVSRVAASLPEPPATVILSGSGEFLARQVLAAMPGRMPLTLSLGERLGPENSAAACAYAVAQLASEVRHAP
jgi:probable H4MPT-linked C1 transfer pathway protein